jgi:amidohydrolase
MDALPIREETGLPFASRHPGIMHACGHDAHMTNVLMAARILSEIKEKIPGTVVFIFQPCEEGNPKGGPSGAHQMIKEGVMENPHIDFMLGLHVMPGAPAGTLALREGPILANVASIYITIKGKSSHGALPHQGIDAIYAASTAIIQFQALISRFKDPNKRAVLTVGKINGGVRMNVVADTVRMEGTVRSFSTKVEDDIEKGIKNILEGLKISTGISYQLNFSRGTKFVKNNIKLTRLITPLFKKLLGENRVFITDPVTVGEDFSAYSHRVPSLFFLLGAGMGMTIHHPKFSVDEKIFLYGPYLFSSAALKIMQSGIN